MDDTASLLPSSRFDLVRPSAEQLAALARDLAELRHLPPGERLDALLADQRRRWQRSERLPVETYRDALPELAEDIEALLHLITAEAMLRRQSGERMDSAEYLTRFPEHADTLVRQFEVEAAIDTAGLTGISTHDSRETVDLPANFPPPPEPPIGVPGFEILSELGRGGMGVVYKARQVGLNRLVALKMILASRNHSEPVRDRFRREAEAIAQLSHPHIVPVHACGEHNGQIYFALGFVGGGSLAQKLRGEKPWSPRRAAELVAVLAGAVQHAHEKGIIHRDLKPANILLDDDGRPHITDFGLARSIQNACLTADGAVLGTPAYMAPEQAAGLNEVTGPATDVYGLGAILYQLLTGRPPHQGTDVRTTLHLASRGRVAPVRSLNPSVPASLARICERALSAEAKMRYASAALLEKDLRRYLSWSRRLVLTAGYAGVLALAGVVVGWSMFLPLKPMADGGTVRPDPERPPPVDQVELTGDIRVRITSNDGLKNGLNVRDIGAVPARNGELVQIEVEMNRPAYLYLVWIDNVSSVGIYPWDHNNPKQPLTSPPPPQKPTRRLRHPAKLNHFFPLEGPTCLETVLLLARETPLPAGVNVAELVGTLPTVPLDPRAQTEVLYRGFNTSGRVADENLHQTRGVGALKKIDNPLLDLMERLRGHFDVIRAIRFPKIGANPDAKDKGAARSDRGP